MPIARRTPSQVVVKGIGFNDVCYRICGYIIIAGSWFGSRDLGDRVWDLGFRVDGLEFRV